uniref:Uncharacterized protein n=1 Tax=Cacopsylla melanoneura TaxID=428564 RepID=A0A8D9A2B2_9HEMI
MNSTLGWEKRSTPLNRPSQWTVSRTRPIRNGSASASCLTSIGITWSSRSDAILERESDSTILAERCLQNVCLIQVSLFSPPTVTRDTDGTLPPSVRYHQVVI